MDQVRQLRKNPPRPTRAVLRPLFQTKAPKAEANAVLAETEDVHMRSVRQAVCCYRYCRERWRVSAPVSACLHT
jgi:hypothetical protein